MKTMMEELQLLIKNTGLSLKDFCKEVGISYEVWKKRIKNPSGLTVREMRALIFALGLTRAEAKRIFFQT